MSAALKDTGLLSRLKPWEADSWVFVTPDAKGAEPVLATLRAALTRFPALNAMMCVPDYYALRSGTFVAHWTWHGGTIRAARPSRQPAPSANTPWGRPDSFEVYGMLPLSAATADWRQHEIRFYHTPSHGGFHIPDESVKLIPTDVILAKSRAHEPCWFEEDRDWGIVALAFPDLFTQPEVDRAHNALTHGEDQSAAFWADALAKDPASPNLHLMTAYKVTATKMAQAVRDWHPTPPKAGLTLHTDLSEVAL
ncbi:MAG: DUF7007 domain-containing protein [Opitutia bacterium]